MAALLTWLMAHIEAVSVGVVDAILLVIPSLKSNNIVQVIGNVLSSIAKAIASVVNPPAPPAA